MMTLWNVVVTLIIPLLIAIILAIRMVVAELRELVGWQRLASPEAWSDARAAAPEVTPSEVTPSEVTPSEE